MIRAFMDLLNAEFIVKNGTSYEDQEKNSKQREMGFLSTPSRRHGHGECAEPKEFAESNNFLQ